MLDLSVVDRAERRIGRIISFVFPASVAIMAFEVAARYLFNAPTIWAHESTTTLSAIGFLFGGAYAQQQRAHIRITSLHMHFSPTLRWTADLIAYLVMLFYVGVFLYAGGILAVRSWETMETSASAWNQPTPVVVKTALVIASGLLALQVVAQLLQHFGLAKGEDRVPGEAD